MQQDNAMIWGIRDSVLHTSEIEAFSLFREVRVGSDREVDVGEDLVVVGPCWVAEVDGGRAGVEFREEESSQVHSTCAGNGLDGACTLFGEGG